MNLLRKVGITSLLAWTLAFGSVVDAGCNGGKKPQAAPPPAGVFVSPVVRRDMAIFVEAVGALDGYVNADIRARVKGYLKTQDYKDGSTVKEGQLLFTIDPAEYQASVDSARAGLARAIAARTNAHATLERNKNLTEAGIASAQTLENAEAANADANGQVMAAQAALEEAELNLSYTKIKAPNAGIAGLAQVRVGNLVGQDGPTLLTTVSQVDPIRMNFPMSETDFVRFPERLKKLDGRDLAWVKKQFPKLDAHQKAEGDDSGIELLLADGSVYPHRGLIVTANRQIDASTGTIQLQALFPNPDGLLRPGQYGRARIRRENEGHDALVVPEKSLISVQGTYSVAVVGQGNKVELRRVELGSAVNGFRIVNSGLKEGESIVVEGMQKVTDGAIVAPQPAPPPSASAAASTPPPDSAQPVAPPPNPLPSASVSPHAQPSAGH